MELKLEDLTREQAKLLYYQLEYAMCILRGDHLGSPNPTYWEMLIFNMTDRIDPDTYYNKVYTPIKELADSARTSDTTAS